MRQLLFRIDLDTGMYWSEMGRRALWPVLDFTGMSPANNFKTDYSLEFFEDYRHQYDVPIIGTKKVPLDIKNAHREKWGLKPIWPSKGSWTRRLISLCPGESTPHLLKSEERKLLEAFRLDPTEWSILITKREEHVRYWIKGVEKKLMIGWGVYLVHNNSVSYELSHAQKILVRPKRRRP